MTGTSHPVRRVLPRTLLVLCWLGVGPVAAQTPESSADPQALLDRYCITCHNARARAGDLLLDALDITDVTADPETWEKVVRKVQTGMMPPSGARRPSRAALDGLSAYVAAALDAAAADHPDPGAPALHRLNRTEYANAVRDLLDLPIDVTTMLPGDDSSDGFDNIANVLSVSPALMQAWVSAAARISRLAVGDETMTSTITSYVAPRGLSHADQFEGQGLGTRGGMLVEHVFPLDAEYELDVRRAGAGFGLPAVGGGEPLEITLDGARAALVESNVRGPVRLTVPAGAHTLGATLVKRSNSDGVDDLYAEHAASVGVQSLSITGPIAPSGPGDTPSRRRIFTCLPAQTGEEAPCAREILRTLAGRAFRRPLAETDPTLATLMEFYEDGRTLRGFETGVQYALARILVDPQFLYRFEAEPEDLAPGAVYRIDDLELASRLSFFLWSSIPDNELLAVAAEGRLSDPDVLERQTRRMLADPRAASLVDNFAAQWLLLRQLDTASPGAREFDGNLRYAFRRETELLFETIVAEDRSIVDLIDADYTFVDERLARHYGIPNVRGSRFRRVTLDDERRRGLLGQGTLLTVTSPPDRTSPVARGKWVLENLLGAPVPSPPADVDTTLQASHAGEPSSLRERLERHRANPACAACHRIMDPVGFALENFDAIGRWRDTEEGVPVDATGRLVDGTELDGPASLRQAFLDRRESFVGTAVEKLLTYALGRRLESADMPAVRAVVRQAAPEDYRVSSLIVGIVESVPFQMRKKG